MTWQFKNLISIHEKFGDSELIWADKIVDNIYTHDYLFSIIQTLLEHQVPVDLTFLNEAKKAHACLFVMDEDFTEVLYELIFENTDPNSKHFVVDIFKPFYGKMVAEGICSPLWYELYLQCETFTNTSGQPVDLSEANIYIQLLVNLAERYCHEVNGKSVIAKLNLNSYCYDKSKAKISVTLASVLAELKPALLTNILQQDTSKLIDPKDIVPSAFGKTRLLFKLAKYREFDLLKAIITNYHAAGEMAKLDIDCKYTLAESSEPLV